MIDRSVSQDEIKQLLIFMNRIKAFEKTFIVQKDTMTRLIWGLLLVGGLDDKQELDKGTNPWNSDTDGDGVPDGVDPDYEIDISLEVILSYNPNVDNESLEFVQALANATDLTLVSPQDLLASYTNAPNIVLIGQPDSTNNDPVGGLIYSLLKDTGSTLIQMMQPDADKISVRYGTWNDTQTVVILTQADPIDVSLVISILSNKYVTIRPDQVTIDYQAPPVEAYSLERTTLVLQEIDIVKQTDSIIMITFDTFVTPTIQIDRYNKTTTPITLNQANGLASNEKAIGNYLNLSLTIDEDSVSMVSDAYILFFYRHSDLDRNHNGLTTDPEDINETTLVFYYYDDSEGKFIRLAVNTSGVIDMGVNTNDLELYGELYAGYAWLRIIHTSMFTLGGQINAPPQLADNLLSLAIMISGLIAAAGATYLLWRRQKKGF